MSEAQREITWRSVEDDPPQPGAYVELSKDREKPLDRIYWLQSMGRRKGLFWRDVPTPNYRPVGLDVQDGQDPWFVVRAEPQQEVPVVWRMHELGEELYVPLIRERRRTNRRNGHGQKVTVLRPKPMFPGYGFLRATGDRRISEIEAVRGVLGVMRAETKPVLLPHEAILVVLRKQREEHQKYIQSFGGRASDFKPGDLVRVSDHGVYSGLVANVEKLIGKERIQVLFGMIRHTLPADMVVAA